jgi:rhodanese-related sulfurtransferase
MRVFMTNRLLKARTSELEFGGNPNRPRLYPRRAQQTRKGEKKMISGFLQKLTGTDVPVIDHDELLQALEQKQCILVDVREPHEFQSGHVPGALNLPLSTFDPSQIAKGKPVVLICQAGGRSGKALRQALNAGRQDVRHYPGGTSGWRARGGPVA